MRIGPATFDASPTARPPCVISASPRTASRRAAARAASISGRQSSAETARAASLGQIVAPARRAPSSMTIARSSCSSTLPIDLCRHASEQYRTLAQSRAHFFRQVIARPQTMQGFGGIVMSEEWPNGPSYPPSRSLNGRRMTG